MREAASGPLDVNGWHNLVHLTTGALGLLAVAYGARAYALGSGLVYIVVAVWGFAIGSGESILSVVPINTADKRPARRARRGRGGSRPRAGARVDGGGVAMRRPIEIQAARSVPATLDAVFAFLAELENHWELGGRSIEVLRLDRPHPGASPHGGRVRVRGPLGVRRTAETRVLGVRAPREMFGSARIGRRTYGRVRWTLIPRDGGTLVRLSAVALDAGRLDWVLLALGGGAWARRRFAGVLDRLVGQFEARPVPTPRPTSTYAPASEPLPARGPAGPSAG